MSNNRIQGALTYLHDVVMFRDSDIADSIDNVITAQYVGQIRRGDRGEPKWSTGELILEIERQEMGDSARCRGSY